MKMHFIDNFITYVKQIPVPDRLWMKESEKYKIGFYNCEFYFRVIFEDFLSLSKYFQFL